MTRNAGTRENGLPRKMKPKTKERQMDLVALIKK